MTKSEFYARQAKHLAPMTVVFDALIESVKDEMPWKTKAGIERTDDDKRALARELFNRFYDEDAQIELWRIATGITNNYSKAGDEDYVKNVVDTLNSEFNVSSSVIRGSYESDDSGIRASIAYKLEYQARRFCYHALN